MSTCSFQVDSPFLSSFVSCVLYPSVIHACIYERGFSCPSYVKKTLVLVKFLVYPEFLVSWSLDDLRSLFTFLYFFLAIEPVLCLVV